MVCLWSDELGAREAWRRLVKLGLLIQPSAGSNTTQNYCRTMAAGSARIYAKAQGALSVKSFLTQPAGRSFVSKRAAAKRGLG